MSMTVGMTPRPFVGDVGDIQRAAIASWSRAGAQVILLGDAFGVEQEARDAGLLHLPEVELAPSGVPSVAGLIDAIVQHAGHSVRALVNSDIVLASDLAPIVDVIRCQLPSGAKWLGVSRRTNVPWRHVRDAAQPSLRSLARGSGRLHPASGSDFFLFGSDPWPAIPPLAVGRTFWDAWLIWAAHRNGALILDLTPSLILIHPTEEAATPVALEATWFGPEAQANARLTGRRGRTVIEADRVLFGGRLRHWAASPPHLFGRLPARLMRVALRASPGLRRALLRLRWKRNRASGARMVRRRHDAHG